MQPVLKAMGVNEALFQGAKAEFEKVFNDGEKTNFDFYLESTNQKNHLYIEVKYTEQGFGTCKNDDSHKNNFEKVYLKGISNSICLNDNAKKMKGKKDFPIMRKNYQLFRNILRVNSNNDYVVFLYPKANSIAESQFNKFKEKYISKQMSSHVLKAHWENFKQLMSPRFREKFFEYDK